MFLLYFLDTCMNLVQCLQRVPLDVSTDWRYLHQDAGKMYSQMSYIILTSKMKSYWKFSKATICRHMKKNIGYLCWELSFNKPSPSRKRWETSLERRQLVGFCKILTWDGLIFKWILTKNDIKLTLRFAQKVVVNMEFATVKYEILRKPMVLERVEVSLLKSTHYY